MIELLQTEHPVVQAPMAGISTPALVAAVSNAGGLGSLGLGASSVSQSRAAIVHTRTLTDKPFNVNVFCHRPPERDELVERAWIQHFSGLFEKFGVNAPRALNEIYQSFLVDEQAFLMLLELRPPIVSFHFGIPSFDRIAALRTAGITTLASVTSREEARIAEAAGIDGIIAQGYEAGGHRSVFDPQGDDDQLSTFALVQRLVRDVDLPVIAAGGIMDGAGISVALRHGAVAAQLGTAFILCPESSAELAYKERLRASESCPTTMTSVISGRPARGFINDLITHGEGPNSPLPASYPLAYDLAKQLHSAAAMRGNHEFSSYWAGKGAPYARELPAAELMQTLIRELRFASDLSIPSGR